MLGLQKKSLLSSGILKGITDFHSHILPGVDDGAKNMEEACRILTFYESVGIKEVILTPHIMENIPKNTKKHLSLQFQKFKSVYDGNLKLTLGAEYMMDAGLESHICYGPLTIAPHHVLIEMPSLSAPVYYRQRMKDIQAKGYHVVLAHPERYAYMDMLDYEQLKKEQIYFQLNLFSLACFYGQTAKNKARKMLSQGFYDYIGTDIHHLGDSCAFEDKLFSRMDIRRLERLL